MNSSRNIRDIRPTSSDDRYAGTVFSNVNTGKIDEAIAQAKLAPDYGPSFKAREELENFLNVERDVRDTGHTVVDKWDTEADRDSLIPEDVQ